MKLRLKPTPGGLVPDGPGWFVVNARQARWLTGDFGAYTRFEGEDRFPSIGINIGVLEPGQAACYYHGEDEQEDFLVLSGECLLADRGRGAAPPRPGISSTARPGPSTSSSAPARDRARCWRSGPG